MLATLPEPKGKQYEEKGQGSPTVQKLSFKVLFMCSRNTPTQSTKTTPYSRSVGQLIYNVHLATSAWSVFVFWIGGIDRIINSVIKYSPIHC